MQSLRSAIPRLSHQVQHAPLAPFILRHQPVASSSRRAWSSSSSPFAALSKRFSAPVPPLRPHGKSSRGYNTNSPVARQTAPPQEIDWTKIASRVGMAAVAAVGLNYALNRETRGALSPYESSFLNDTFKWTGVGLAITAAVAKGLHSSGFAVRIMSSNPWLVMGLGVVGGIGSMMAVYYTEPGTALHYAAFGAFVAIQGATLSPMFFINPAVLTRAGIYTVGALTGLTYVGATAQSEQFLYLGGPLLCGLGVLVAASLAPMLMPRMAMRTMSMLEHVTAYGGVGLFSMFILYDTQKILKHAQLAQRGVIPRDPVRESVSLIIDAINLFVRMVQVLMLNQNRRK